MIHQYDLDGQPVSVHVEGETIQGEQQVLLDLDDDLAQGATWYDAGYTIAPFVSTPSFETLVSDVTRRLASAVRVAGGDTPESFLLTRYHTYVPDDAMHLRALSAARAGYALADFPIPLCEICDRVSSVLGTRVTPRNDRFGVDRWHVRIVRPRSSDNNPLHRDVWLTRLRNAMNIYVPLAGSNGDSSLPIAPGSHRWPESDLTRTAKGATVNGLSYTVPAVVGSARPLQLIRPNPSPNEMLLFSPYLVHGGAYNRQRDTTRVSLEMRFWRAN